MNATDRTSRLELLASTIRALRSERIEDERTAFDICDPRALERAAMTRARLEVALNEYFVLAERDRSEREKSSSPPR